MRAAVLALALLLAACSDAPGADEPTIVDLWSGGRVLRPYCTGDTCEGTGELTACLRLDGLPDVAPEELRGDHAVTVALSIDNVSDAGPAVSGTLARGAGGMRLALDGPLVTGGRGDGYGITVHADALTLDDDLYGPNDPATFDVIEDIFGNGYSGTGHVVIDGRLPCDLP